jgi:hypothetical protein
MSSRLVIAFALVVSVPLLACKKDEAAPAAATSSSASSASSAAPSVSSSASKTVSVADFCAFMERLMVDQMARRDTDHVMTKEKMQQEAKLLNDGCEKAIGKVAAKDPEAWQGCARCLTSKADFTGLKVCDDICNKVGFGPNPTASSSVATPSSAPAPGSASGAASVPAGR